MKSRERQRRLRPTYWILQYTRFIMNLQILLIPIALGFAQAHESIGHELAIYLWIGFFLIDIPFTYTQIIIITRILRQMNSN